MKQYPIPEAFDGSKFAARYGLSAVRGDFWISDKAIFVPDDLPDDPPIFEAPDPVVAKPTVEEELAAIKTRLAALEADKAPVAPTLLTVG